MVLSIHRSISKYAFIGAVVFFSMASAADITAISNGINYMNGTTNIGLNVSFPEDTGVGYKDFNLTLVTGEYATVTVFNDTSTTKIVTVSYPMEGQDGEKFTMEFDLRQINSLFFIHQVIFNYKLTKADFPSLNISFNGSDVNLTSNIRPKFQTPIGNVFECVTTIPLDLTSSTTSGSKMTFANTHFRAFSNNTDWATATRETCPRDYQSKPDVRIATGSAFAALIIAAIIGAVLLNCRRNNDSE